ncbi:hypothetical protein BC829DRAFT_174079 [Chytridium lagenaria]|nr:hypothetical protein BC829DRAFT_174079 [Chytridium lagenaria]
MYDRFIKAFGLDHDVVITIADEQHNPPPETASKSPTQPLFGNIDGSGFRRGFGDSTNSTPVPSVEGLGRILPSAVPLRNSFDEDEDEDEDEDPLNRMSDPAERCDLTTSSMTPSRSVVPGAEDITPTPHRSRELGALRGFSSVTTTPLGSNLPVASPYRTPSRMLKSNSYEVPEDDDTGSAATTPMARTRRSVGAVRSNDDEEQMGSAQKRKRMG